MAQTLLADTYGAAEVTAWLAGERAQLGAPAAAERPATPEQNGDAAALLMRAFQLPLASGPHAA